MPSQTAPNSGDTLSNGTDPDTDTLSNSNYGHVFFRARLVTSLTRVRPSFFTELNAESAQKALRALLGDMMCVADWLLAGRHTHKEGGHYRMRLHLDWW